MSAIILVMTWTFDSVHCIFFMAAVKLKLLKLKILKLKLNSLGLHATHSKTQQEVYQHAWWLFPVYGGVCVSHRLSIYTPPLQRGVAPTAVGVTVEKCLWAGISLEGSRPPEWQTHNSQNQPLFIYIEKNKPNTGQMEKRCFRADSKRIQADFFTDCWRLKRREQMDFGVN